MYSNLELRTIAKYGMHKHPVMWEVNELVQGESEIVAAFFDRVEMLKLEVVGIMDDFL